MVEVPGSAPASNQASDRPNYDHEERRAETLPNGLLAAHHGRIYDFQRALHRGRSRTTLPFAVLPPAVDSAARRPVR